MLGDILRLEREKQNMTIKDVEAETSIRALYIASIEEGKYDALPGEVYLKGFLRTYAGCLKLDPAAMLKLYYEEKAPQVAANESTTELATDIGAAVSASAQDSSVRSKVHSAKRHKQNKLVKIFAFCTAAVVISGLWYWGFGSDDTPPAALPLKQAQAPIQEKKSAPPAAVVPAKQTGVEIIAKYTDKCWTEVVADNKVLYEGVPKIGESLAWKAEKMIVIRAGNAGAAEIIHNGKAIGTLGDVGEVVVKQFAPDKMTNSK